MKIKSMLSIGMLAILLVTSCSTPTSPEPSAELEPITLKMNSSALTSYAPIFIADAEGYFEEEGITMDFITFNRSTEALPLIVNGDLDIMAGAVSAGFLNIVGQESSIKVVADRGSITPEDTCANHGILFRKTLYDSGELTKPADLKGRTIASSVSGPSGYFLSVYLAQAGLTFDDITISDVPTAGYFDAIANGSIDAIVAPEVRLTQALNDGHSVLVASGSDIYGDLQSSVLAFGKNLLVDNREAGIRFLKAYMRGVKQYQEGKTDRNVEIMVKYTSETEEIIRQACWVTINPNGQINFDQGVAPFQQWNIEQGYLDNPVTEEQFWDSSLLEEALAQLDQ